MTGTQKWAWYWKYEKPFFACSANAIWSALTGIDDDPTSDTFGEEYTLQDDSDAAANQARARNVSNHKVKNFYNRLEINLLNKSS